MESKGKKAKRDSFSCMCIYSIGCTVALIREYTTHTVQAVDWDHP